MQTLTYGRVVVEFSERRLRWITRDRDGTFIDEHESKRAAILSAGGDAPDDSVVYVPIEWHRRRPQVQTADAQATAEISEEGSTTVANQYTKKKEQKLSSAAKKAWETRRARRQISRGPAPLPEVRTRQLRRSVS